MRCPDEVPGLRLAVPVPHRKNPCELPEPALDLELVESEFLSQLAAQRFFWCLSRVYASAWAGPEPVLEPKTWPVKVDQQCVVVFVEHEGAYRLAEPG